VTHHEQLSIAEQLDRDDPLAAFRDRFVITDPDVIYLDGNSLGRLPMATRARLHAAIDEEWGAELINGWDHWIELARQAGDVLGGLVGARPGETVLSDSTSVNLYKLAAAALDARPDRRVIVTDDDNFPTDQYILQGLAAARGLELRVIKTDIDSGVTLDDVRDAVDEDTALLSLSHVAYRSGAIADMPAITSLAHERGALVLWDLCHSAGSVPVDLDGSAADLAVGCTYKHLNGGPGAPAFLFVRADLQDSLRQPIWGWFSQRDQFAMGSTYDPVGGIERFLVGTPSILSGYGALEGARISAEASIAAIAAKGQNLTEYAISLFDDWLAPHGFTLASPRETARRGAQVTLHHPAAWQICQALKAASVIPDFRTPDRLRLGFAPLYTRFVDVYEGMRRLRSIVESGAHLEFPTERSRVT
jgi:kynureninase